MEQDKRQLPTEALTALQTTAGQLEAERDRTQELLRTTQTDTGRRYYEGMIRGIDTALVILMGQAEAERRNMPGDEMDM